MSVVAYILVGLGALVCLMNWCTLLPTRDNRRPSSVPLVGALLLGYGLAVLPKARSIAWLALVVDYGTLVLVIALPRLIYEAWSTSSINLLHCFTATASGRILTIRLFRRHIAVISVQFNPPVPCDDAGTLIGEDGLVGTWSATEYGYLIEGYASDRRLLIATRNGGWITVEEKYPSERKYKYDYLGGLPVEKQK